jgi:hypothetical protein
MRARSLVALSAILLTFRLAHADGRGDVEKKIKEAMEQYDLMDYDAAKKLLNQALATAKKAHLDKDQISAKAYLDLGIVAFVNNDADAAKLAFISAVQIQPKIQIDPAYKTAEMAKLLDQARGDAGGGTGGGTSDIDAAMNGGGGGGAADCSSVHGLQHEIIDSAKGGAALPVEAKLGPDVKASRVSVFYRPEGATDFTEVKMSADGCTYKASIPASGMKGSLVHYYIAAYGDGPKPIAAKGSSGSPNIIEVTAPAPGGGGSHGDDEDPLGGKKDSGGGASGGGEVSSSVTVTGPKRPHIMLAVSGGTGSGYVTGTTEANNPVKSCCIGSPIAVIVPELGYFVSPSTSVSIAARLGLPLGANIDGHATMAPAALIRVRHSLSPTGEGLRVMGQIGAGILRNTIKLDNAQAGMDTDIVAQGPLLIGGGVGFTKNLSGSVAFIADLSALAGIAVVDHLGSAPKLNSGLSADLSLGLQLGF